MNTMTELGKRAKAASRVLAVTSSSRKNEALDAIAKGLNDHIEMILQANGRDVESAVINGMSAAMVDRLKLSADRVRSIAEAVRYVRGLEDPVGVVLGGSTRPNGLQIQKVSVPIGVVGMIFEARPNVTADAAVLCLKSGNACILRGGKEAIHSNKAMAQIMRQALGQVGLPEDCIQLVEDTSRQSSYDMMKCNGLIDVLIPRGGAQLIRAVVENATVPVIETGVGNCHIFVDRSADLTMAVDVVENAKVSRPSVCNAVETVLVHRAVAGEFLPELKRRLDQSHVQLRGCEETRRILGNDVLPASREDYATEFNDYILALRVVEDLEQAMEHIAAYSTGHSEAIMTRDLESARRFTAGVDAAAVYVNASTRFTDGGEFGFGAEIGISTQKLHARGPMGLKELTSCKYIVMGSGQIR